MEVNRVEKDYEKQVRYAELKIRLKKALAGKFWFEACMIEYAIIEDRTASILARTGVSANAYNENKKLSNKLNSIDNQIGKKHPIISKSVKKELIDALNEWKDKRNDLVHRACQHYNEDVARECAMQGKELSNKISDAAKTVSRKIERMQKD